VVAVDATAVDHAAAFAHMVHRFLRRNKQTLDVDRADAIEVVEREIVGFIPTKLRKLSQGLEKVRDDHLGSLSVDGVALAK
jgi:hypothetical protein